MKTERRRAQTSSVKNILLYKAHSIWVIKSKKDCLNLSQVGFLRSRRHTRAHKSHQKRWSQNIFRKTACTLRNIYIIYNAYIMQFCSLNSKKWSLHQNLTRVREPLRYTVHTLRQPIFLFFSLFSINTVNLYRSCLVRTGIA